MNFKAIMVAGAVLTSSLAQATPENDLLLPSTVCFPAVQALQEPTTEANLTPYDPFNHIDSAVDYGYAPDAEPTTTAMAVLVLKEIAKIVGTKIYESIFRDGAKQTLTKADFDRISQIVKEALREDAKRKINTCVVSLQETNKFLATSWDERIAMDTYTTSSAVVDVIINFDHVWSKMALMPSAMLIGSLQAGLAQEFLKREIDKEDKFFDATTGRLQEVANRYLNQMDKEILDSNRMDVKHISKSMSECGSSESGHGWCWNVYSKFWGQFHAHTYEKCEASRDACAYQMEEEAASMEYEFFKRWVEMMNNAYHRELTPDSMKELRSVQIWTEQLKKLPARQPMVNRVKISSPRPNK